LFDHTEFPAIRFKSNQLCHDHEYARRVLNHPVSAKNLATLREMNERTVRRNLLPGPQEPGPPGRHITLTSQSEAALVAMLLDAFHAGQPIGKRQLL
jgi:hypothetical protein